MEVAYALWSEFPYINIRIPSPFSLLPSHLANLKFIVESKIENSYRFDAVILNLKIDFTK